jgi:hypothetical protein
MNQKLKDKWNELVMQVTIFALGSVVLILLAIKRPTATKRRAQRDC